jgi:hypothetical protein
MRARIWRHGGERAATAGGVEGGGGAGAVQAVAWLCYAVSTQVGNGRGWWRDTGMESEEARTRKKHRQWRKKHTRGRTEGGRRGRTLPLSHDRSRDMGVHSISVGASKTTVEILGYNKHPIKYVYSFFCVCTMFLKNMYILTKCVYQTQHLIHVS